MEHSGNISDMYNPWRNSDTIPDYSDSRSYNLHIEKEGLTEVELRVNGPLGRESTFTAPKSIFDTYIL